MSIEDAFWPRKQGKKQLVGNSLGHGIKCNEWISLAFIKLGIDRPEAVIDRAFVENHALVPKTAN